MAAHYLLPQIHVRQTAEKPKPKSKKRIRGYNSGFGKPKLDYATAVKLRLEGKSWSEVAAEMQLSLIGSKLKVHMTNSKYVRNLPLAVYQKLNLGY